MWEKAYAYCPYHELLSATCTFICALGNKQQSLNCVYCNGGNLRSHCVCTNWKICKNDRTKRKFTYRVQNRVSKDSSCKLSGAHDEDITYMCICIKDETLWDMNSYTIANLQSPDFQSSSIVYVAICTIAFRTQWSVALRRNVQYVALLRGFSPTFSIGPRTGYLNLWALYPAASSKCVWSAGRHTPLRRIVSLWLAYC